MTHRHAGVLLLLLGACSTAPTAEWRAEVALRAGEKLGGCAAGDLIPERPGLELAVVGASGKVWLVYRDGDDWVSEVLTQTPGEMVQCAAGDLDPRRPGDELVVVGMAEGAESDAGPGAAHWIRRDGELWTAQELLRDPALLHGVCVTAGRAFAAGFSSKLFAIEPSGDGFASRVVADLPGAGKSCVAMREGIAVACLDGSVLFLSGGPESYRATVVDQRPAGRARVGTDGDRIAVADDDGMLSVLSPSGRREVWQDGDKLRGAVLGDLDPDSLGHEVACAGYSHAVTLLTLENRQWVAHTLHEEQDRLHHLVGADLDGEPGLELATCGFAGNVVVLRRAGSP